MEIVPWIGPLGGLRPILHANSVEMTEPARTVVKATIGGLPRAQRLSARGRTWKVGGQFSQPTDMASLRYMADGYVGAGQLVLVSELAQVQNLLTADESWCRDRSILGRSGVTASGGFNVPIEDPLAGSYLIDRQVQPGVVPLGQLLPVAPGQPVHGSVWVSGPAGARLWLIAYNAAGGQLGSIMGGVQSAASGVSRITVLRESMPAGTAWVALGVSGADQVTMPQVTWQKQRTQWGVGQGARSVVISDLTSQLKHLSRHTEAGAYSDFEMTIKEVGP